MMITIFTLFVIIVVSFLGIEEDLDCYEEFDRKKKREEYDEHDQEGGLIQ